MLPGGSDRGMAEERRGRGVVAVAFFLILF